MDKDTKSESDPIATIDRLTSDMTARGVGQIFEGVGGALSQPASARQKAIVGAAMVKVALDARKAHGLPVGEWEGLDDA